MANHIIDPTYFYDAIAEFAFDYELYVKTGTEIDELGMAKNTWTKTTISGSLQSQGTTKRQSRDGNIVTSNYDFYCKSLYRIDIGDFIHYKDKWLKVTSVHDYDEWGVRSCSTEMVSLSAYKDLSEYFNYIKGKVTV